MSEYKYSLAVYTQKEDVRRFVKLNKTLGVRSQYTHNHLPLTTLEWFHLHFPTSGFDGRFQLGYRRADSTLILPLTTLPRSDMLEFLQLMHVSCHCDYYITGNSVNGVKRQKEALFSLHNITIDIDLHHAGSLPEDDGPNIFEDFVWRLRHDLFDEEDFPAPTSIVYTGRGLQLWWSIVPMSYKCLPWFEEIRDTLIKALELYLQEESAFSGFTVDAAASGNTVGYFRLPGTVNTKSLTEVVAERISGKQYDTHQMIQWAKAWKLENTECVPERHSSTYQGSYTDAEVFILKDFKTSAFFRVNQLIQLRSIRNNDIGQETRNNMCFIFYNAVLPALGPAKAWEKLLAFNNGFKQPMTEKELHQTIDTSLKKGGYHYKNKTLIRFFNITPEEQELLGLYAPTQPYSPLTRLSGHPSRKAVNALKKNTRNDRIRSMYEEGKSAAAIAEDLGISLPTVSAVLDLKGKKEQQREQLRQLARDGLSAAEIASTAGVSVRTAQRVRESLKIEQTTKFKKVAYI